MVALKSCSSRMFAFVLCLQKLHPSNSQDIDIFTQKNTYTYMYLVHVGFVKKAIPKQMKRLSYMVDQSTSDPCASRGAGYIYDYMNQLLGGSKASR